MASWRATASQQAQDELDGLMRSTERALRSRCSSATAPSTGTESSTQHCPRDPVRRRSGRPRRSPTCRHQAAPPPVRQQRPERHRRESGRHRGERTDREQRRERARAPDREDRTRATDRQDRILRPDRQDRVRRSDRQDRILRTDRPPVGARAGRAHASTLSIRGLSRPTDRIATGDRARPARRARRRSAGRARRARARRP